MEDQKKKKKKKKKILILHRLSFNFGGVVKFTNIVQ